MKTDEQVIENYEKYVRLLTKYFGEESTSKLQSCLGERLAVSPRGLTLAEGGEAGGLVEFALKVAKNTKMVAEVCDQKSLVRVALLHELGKLGDDTNEQFLPQESSWHLEKLGQHFKYNDACEKMSYIHRTLYFVSKFGFQLNSDEWIAILTSGGLHLEENRFYARDNHVLSHMLQACKCLAENELKASAKSFS